MFLNKPYPIGPIGLKPALFQAIPIGFFVALFLMVFQPFGLAFIPSPQKYWIIPFYGLITFAVIILFLGIMKPALPRVFSEERWTAGKEILENLSLITGIAVGNYLYTWIIGGAVLGWSQLLFMFFATLTVGIFPVVAMVGISYIHLLKRNNREAQSLNSMLHVQAAPEEKSLKGWITIPSKYQQDEVSLNVEELLWISAADNYVALVSKSRDERMLKKQLVRNTLAELEPLLAPYGILRCHRSYMINLAQVQHISGNAQGYRLHLADVEEQVPVSRGYASGIQQKLAEAGH